MTNRLTLGVDPGQTGAIAALADGVPAGFVDMPTYPRKAGGNEIDPFALAASIRGLRMQHPGAFVSAILEQVGAMPGQGGTGMFRFGQSDGIVRGVLGALGIAWTQVAPRTWKARMGLIGAGKDAARLLAIERYPGLARQLALKKNIGRADALLIAAWDQAYGAGA